MATWWRWCRHCRLQAPSKIASRNRNLIYATVFLPLFMTVLLIPGGEITNFKFSGNTRKDLYVATFNHHGDDVIREARSLRNKMILLWTSFFEFRTWRVTGDAFKACPVSTCELSLDRRKAPEADAVLFNARGIQDPSALPDHPPWQVSVCRGPVWGACGWVDVSVSVSGCVDVSVCGCVGVCGGVGVSVCVGGWMSVCGCRVGVVCVVCMVCVSVLVSVCVYVYV